jgi:hypothetical protein
MAETHYSGPLIVFGQTPAQSSLTPDYNPSLGPSMFYAGTSLLDPRLPFTYLPGEARRAQKFAFLGADNITTLSIVPYTKATSAVVASANPTGATLALVSANSATTGAYITPGITRSDTGAVDTNGGAGLVALDAYTSVTGSIANGVLTVTTNNAMPITPGMALVSVANTTAGTVPAILSTSAPNNNVAPITVLAQLTGGSGGQGVAGTYAISDNTLTSTSGTITLAIPSPQFCAVPFGDPATYSPSMWNPQALVGRAVAVTAAAGATYTTATVSGYDIYGYPLVEAITITAGSQVSGKKAFKYIKSVVLSGGSADTTHAYSVDTTDVFGLPLRSDSFADITVNYATSVTAVTGITAATNYVAGDKTSPATATTGDVRGTYTAASSTGANKLVVRQSPQAQNVGSTTGLFGIAQYTNF